MSTCARRHEEASIGGGNREIGGGSDRGTIGHGEAKQIAGRSYDEVQIGRVCPSTQTQEQTAFATPGENSAAAKAHMAKG